MVEQRTERFTGTSGRVLGSIGLASVAIAVAVGIFGDAADYHPAAYPALGLVAVLLWAAMLRPSVAVVDDRLVLRNMLETVTIPLAAIEQVSVRQYLAVGVAGRRYTNAGVSRTRRQGLRDDRHEDGRDLSYGGFVESRIRRLTEAARDQQGIGLMSDAQAALAEHVRRQRAWPEIGLLAGFGLAFLVALFL